MQPHIFDIEFDGQDIPAIAMVDPAKIREGSDIEDLVGEATLFGVVDRIVGEGRTFSLEKYLLPGMNRAARRVMGGRG